MSLAQRSSSLSVVALAAVLLGGCSGDAAETTAATTAPAPADAVATAEPISLTWSVGGLHCDGCVQGVTQTVAAIPGVSQCDVSLEEGRMVVAVDSEDTGTRVAEAVRGMNYTVARLPDAPSAAAPAEPAGEG